MVISAYAERSLTEPLPNEEPATREANSSNRHDTC